MVLVPILCLVACAILLKWNFVLKSKLDLAEFKLTELEEERQELGQKLESGELQQRLFSRLVSELSILSEQLHSRVKARNIPKLLLQIIQRNFEPKQAVVLLRRELGSESRREVRLAVVAVHPAGSNIKRGTEIAVGQGELGFVAEAQLTMNRYDFDRSLIDPDEPNDQSFPGFRPELAAPLVFNEETLGVIALSGSPYREADAKKALRLIAKIGAVALKNVVAYSQMKLTAEIDGLTRSFNKRYMILALGDCIHQAEQRLSTFSVLLFDIDNFKNYNDLNGHVAGDQLLRELALLVQDNIRDEDVFGRFGGEEFLLILTDTPADEALEMADRLREVIMNAGFAFAERQPLGVLSVSGGVATYPTDALDSTGLLKSADEAMYAGKKQGRNRVLLGQEQCLSGGQGELAVTHSNYSDGNGDVDSS